MSDIDRIAAGCLNDIGVIDYMSTPTELGEIKDLIRAALLEYGAIVCVERDAEIEQLRSLLAELYALVKGECPSLLNEDSGGDARLDLNIDAALRPR